PFLRYLKELHRNRLWTKVFAKRYWRFPWVWIDYNQTIERGDAPMTFPHRLDAEIGVDNIKVESMTEGGPADLGDAEEIAATFDNIKAESSSDVPAGAAAPPAAANRAGHCEEPAGRRSNPESRYRNPPPAAEERGEGAGLLRFARNDA